MIFYLLDIPGQILLTLTKISGNIFSRGEKRKMNDYVITIDVDWASDSIIVEVVNYLVKNKVKATWFITHDSEQIRELFKYPYLFELGIHPNFHERSTQGKTPGEVMSYLQKIVPQAKLVRTHDLMQSSSLLKMMREEFNILYDVSLLLPNTPNIIPHEIFYSKDIGLLRFPYFWEDDIEIYNSNPCFSFKHKKYHVPGLKIFNFHPIHILLNSCNMENYNNFKRAKNPSITDYINENQGIGTFFREIVQFLINNTDFPGQTISDLADKWRNSR